MGSSHSVIWGSKQREDISYSDIEYKHGKLWNTLAPRDDHLSLTSVFRFSLFMGVSCNNMQNDEEQSPVAVRLPKNCLFLLKQLKNWIANNFSKFNAAKINSPIYKELIYRSPGAGQQMVNARYRIVLQIKKQDALYQGANRFQMLPWDAHEPPPKRFTCDGGWYIVSIKVLKDEMDLGGQRPDNPDVHLKVILHVANCMTWTTPVVNPCLLNYHVENTLNSEERDKIVRIQKIFLPNEQPKYPSLNFPNPVPSTIIPNPRCFNNEAIHEDHQDLNANRNSRKRPLSTNYKADNRAAAGLKAFSILLLLTSPAAAYPVSAYPVSQGHQVEIKCLQDSDKNLNCTLKIDNKYILCYGHCDQNLMHHQHIYDDTVENLLVNVSKQHENAMEVNQISLMRKHNLSSGNLELIFLWELDKVFNNATNETIQYIFNDKKLTDEEMTYLPMTSTYFLNCDPNNSVYMEKMKDYVKGLWESIREKILPFLKIDDQPGTTESWVIAVSTVIPVSIIFILIFIVLSRKYGMKSCKTVTETICKAAYGQVSQTEAQGSPNWMEAPEREDMTSSV